MGCGDGFRNGYCILFLATTIAISFAIETFLSNQCSTFPDDVIDFGTYQDCVKQCQKIENCHSISYKSEMSVCKMHFNEDDNERAVCQGYVHSRKEDWTPEDEPPFPPRCDTLRDCSSLGEKCRPLLSPHRGMLLGNRFSEGHKVTVVCNPGYTVNGSKQRTCESGNWTGEEATCVEDPMCERNLLWGEQAVERVLSESSNWCKEVCGYSQTANELCPECMENLETMSSHVYSQLNATGVLTGGWIARRAISGEYIQADFLQARIVSAIAIQERYNYEPIDNQFVTKFILQTSNDCSTFINITDTYGGVKLFCDAKLTTEEDSRHRIVRYSSFKHLGRTINPPQIFEGTTGPDEIVIRPLPERIRTRCVRLYPSE